MKFTVSLAQLYIAPGKIDANIKLATDMIQAAASRSSHLVLLPELWASGYDLENAPRHASQTPQILKNLARLADLHNLRIGGSLLEERGGSFYNTFYWVGPDLDEPIVYRKIHLFRLMEEDRWLQAGDTLQMVNTDWGKVGLAICYDLRFPELFRSYAMKGAQYLALSAEWPAKRIHHWQTLLRARAIENQCFVFATNCVGPTHKDQFGGCSMAITPWGETLVEGNPTQPDLLHAEIDTDLLDRARKFLPVFQDRRPELYE